MAKWNINNFDKELKAKMDKVLDELTKPEVLKEMGEKLIKEIQVRTRLGYGVEESKGSQSKLKPLSEDYKIYRKTKQLDSTTSPSKSNLSFTGDMLRSLVAKPETGKVVIQHNDELSKKKTEWNADKGRVYMNISKTQFNNLIKFIKEKIKSLV